MIATRNELAAEMLNRGVKFDNTPADRRFASGFSRVGKTTTTNRKTRLAVYDRIVDVKMTNAEGRELDAVAALGS